MYEFAATEFDTIMLGFPKFQRIVMDEMHTTIGITKLGYSDGVTTIEMISSSEFMHLIISVTVKGKRNPVTMFDDYFTDFAALKEAALEFLL